MEIKPQSRKSLMLGTMEQKQCLSTFLHPATPSPWRKLLFLLHWPLWSVTPLTNYPPLNEHEDQQITRVQVPSSLNRLQASPYTQKWWHSLISALENLKQENCEFKVILSYVVNSVSNRICSKGLIVEEAKEIHCRHQAWDVEDRTFWWDLELTTG